MKNQKHLTLSTIFLFISLITFIGLIGCSKSNDKIDANCNNWSEQFLAQANAYSEAANVYAEDPTMANCGKLKTAGLNYIDALESVIDCVPAASSQAYRNDLNEYRAEVNSIDCN